MSPSEPRIYQIKVTLRHVRPPVWRRLLVASDLSLHHLHLVLQQAMGWGHCHLHAFIKGWEELSSETEDCFEADPQEVATSLSSVLVKKGDKLRYDYDFGDGWEHDIVLEKELPNDGSVATARCIAGARACPPEDCGGSWGYEQLLKVLANPKHPEHEEMLEWLGEEFDPEFFSIEEVNRAFDAPVR